MIDQSEGAEAKDFNAENEGAYREREAMFFEESVGIEQELEECERLIMAQMDESTQNSLTLLN